MKTKQFLVIGLGRFGSSLATELYRMGHQVLGVDADEEDVNAISDFLTHGIVGDVTNENFFESLGASNFDAVIIGIGTDYEASILAVMQAKEMKIPKIIAKARDINHMKVLYRLGADKVVIPERDIGKRLAHALTFSSNIIEVIELSEEFGIIQISALPEWWGKSLKESDIRSEFGLTVIALRRGDHLEINPPADFQIEEGDNVYVLGKQELLLKLEKVD